jgi:hypothetical protein
MRRGPSVKVLVLSWLITLYMLWQMVEMLEMVEGKRLIATTSRGRRHSGPS